ncbi:galactose mutarotase-like domain-containing protein [Phyllosticta capitalensis]|uniref:galactose mutarotase-like domain-containing protein n=1 Tax=Phyllosticta capitalensis TaxID=121624 RepID=UPI0031328172
MVAATAFQVALALALSAAGVSAQNADGKYTISAEGIRANFIPYGASISNLFLNDSNGIERDIVLGFDNASYYSIDKLHPHLGGVPGRYANRIKNGTFEIDGITYNTVKNENDGVDTLHGGSNGWDWRNWTVAAYTSNSITFTLFDKDGEQGFPGDVQSFVQYTLTPYTWHLKMGATALTKKTPIMLSSHTYWNLDGFQSNDTANALNHTFSLPYSGQRVGVDSILIPDGTILPNEKGSVNDFWSSPKQIGKDIAKPEIQGNCGAGCAGYDTCFIVNRAQDGPYDWRTKGPVASLSSDFSGIKVDVFTDQDAFQMYSCNSMNGTLPIKNTQGFFNNTNRPRVVEKYGCVVMEVEDWIDSINQPEWQREKKNIFGPETDPYVLQAEYRFTVGGKGASSRKTEL